MKKNFRKYIFIRSYGKTQTDFLANPITIDIPESLCYISETNTTL